MSATDKALATTELLEAILVELPVGVLLKAQLVSRTWHLTIATSKALQRALFLAPSPANVQVYAFHDTALFKQERTALEREHAIKSAASHSSGMREELEATKYRLFLRPNARYWQWRAVGNNELCTVRVNPLLRQLLVPLETESLAWDYMVHLQKLDTLTETPDSWFDMFVTSPPCSELVIRFGSLRSHLVLNAEERTVVGKDGAGVRIGDVIRKLKAANFGMEKVAVRVDGSVAWTTE